MRIPNAGLEKCTWRSRNLGAAEGGIFKTSLRESGLEPMTGQVLSLEFLCKEKKRGNVRGRGRH